MRRLEEGRRTRGGGGGNTLSALKNQAALENQAAYQPYIYLYVYNYILYNILRTFFGEISDKQMFMFIFDWSSLKVDLIIMILLMVRHL